MTMLIAWLWQGLLLVAVVELLLRATPRVNATTRHAIWWAALLGVMAIPLAHYASNALAHPGFRSAAVTPALATANHGAPIELPVLPDWIGALLLGVWSGTVLLGTARLWNGLAAIRRLESGSYPMPEARQTRLDCWTAWRGRGRRAELRLSNAHPGAAALGFGSPLILVGAALAEVLDDEELDAIVMHEYAHVARRDDWSRILQALIETVAGLHPAVALIARRIDVERETACDDWVVRHVMSTRQYAACLTELAALVRSGNPPEAYAIVPGATGSRGSLYTRVQRLLDCDLDRSRRIWRAPFWAAALGAGSVLVLAITADPLVTFTHAAAPEPRLASTAASPVASTAGAAATAQEAPVGARSRRATTAPPLSTPEVAREPVESSTHQPPVAMPAADSVEVPDALSPEHQTLIAHSFPQAAHPAPAAVAVPVALHYDDAAGQDGAWERMAAAGTQVGTSAARGGTAIGQGARRAGLSVAGFFARAGKGVAGSF